MIETVLYILRHKATGEIMPVFRRGRGYSSWNPGNLSAPKIAAEVIGWRFFKDRKQAIRVRLLWFTQPNLHADYDYEGSEIGLNIKPDGRKLEDLEIVAIELKEITEELK